MAGLTPEPLRAVEALFDPDLIVGSDTVEDAPAWKGAYLMLLRLGAEVSFSRGKLVHPFGPGWYAYAGNAYGPGGVGARLRRHFRREKKLHWHVDHLTGHAERMNAFAFRDGSECRIVSRLVGSGAFRPSLEGFGSSDCPACTSHLLEWRGEVTA